MFGFKRKEKKYRILSIDGGGMKGVFTAYALWKLEEDYDIKVIDYFDMIVGTSTGALIVSGLLSGTPYKKIYETYMDDQNKIFSNKKSFMEQFKSIFFAGYNTEGLIEYLTKEIGDHTLESLYKKTKKDFAFFASNFTKAKPIIYASPSLSKSTLVKNNISLIEALRTSTAAPFYFEPMLEEDTDHLIMDGGLWANNPSLTAINLAVSEKGIKLSNIEVLSFGQSFTDDLNFKIVKGKELIKSPMKQQFAQLLLSVLTLNQNTQTLLVKNLIGNRVYRYEPEVFQSGVAVDKVNNKFINYTKVYWEKNKNSLVDFIKTGNNTKE
ncbi:MAG: patatin-like phospholipase family protein [Mycoplasmataceae bacterium]|nr:patatin-like phospholipase family protein [Mycoplasmataceae bacterium]